MISAKKLEKYLKSKNDIKRPLGAFNQKLWANSNFKNQKFKSDFPRGKWLENLLTENASQLKMWKQIKNKNKFLGEIYSFFVKFGNQLKKDFKVICLFFWNCIDSWLKHFCFSWKSRMPAAGVHQPSFFSLRGPAKVLHQRAREARELCGWTDGWTDGRWSKVSFDFPYFDVC